MSPDSLSTGRFWRIRGRDATGTDRTADAWARNEVGIWYGGWTAGDWIKATVQNLKSTAAYLTDVPRQRALAWDVPKAYVDTARRFADMRTGDWVITFCDGNLNLGRVAGPMSSEDCHPLNCGLEVFKYREIAQPKSFRLGRLPDVFRLLPSAGRGNVHEYQGTNRRLIELLARSSSEAEVAAMFAVMPLAEWLDFLGPAEWESLCLGFLILTENFLPTGLSVGRTLPALDIVGVNSRTGRKIFAQCKKDSGVVEIDPAFTDACRDMPHGSAAFYFAYGGCRDAVSPVRVVTGDDIREWLTTAVGMEYSRVWRESVEQLDCTRSVTDRGR